MERKEDLTLTNKQMLVAQLRKEQEQNRILRIELERSARLTGKDVFVDAYKIITEQEQEIARLRAILKQCNIELNSALESLKSQCREIGKLKAEVKQAQIDVLKELKKYLHTEDFDTPDERWKPESEFCAIIDQLINEVENE